MIDISVTHIPFYSKSSNGRSSLNFRFLQKLLNRIHFGFSESDLDSYLINPNDVSPPYLQFRRTGPPSILLHDFSIQSLYFVFTK